MPGCFYWFPVCAILLSLCSCCLFLIKGQGFDPLKCCELVFFSPYWCKQTENKQSRCIPVCMGCPLPWKQFRGTCHLLHSDTDQVQGLWLGRCCKSQFVYDLTHFFYACLFLVFLNVDIHFYMHIIKNWVWCRAWLTDTARSPHSQEPVSVTRQRMVSFTSYKDHPRF